LQGNGYTQYKTFHDTVYLLFGILVLFIGTTMHTNASTLVLAQLSERPKKDYKELRPMVTYMAKQLSSVGITGGEVRLFRDMDKLIAAINRGEVHWVTETAKSTAIIVNRTSSDVLLSKWKNNQKSYSSLLYTRHDSAIKSINDLVGRVIAFENEDSFSSAFIPRVLIEEQGLALQKLDHIRATPNSDKVGYVFSRNEKNNILWTAKGLVDAGVVNDGDWENKDRLPLSLKGKLRVFHRSEKFPRAFEITTFALPKSVSVLLKQKLLAMADNNGRDVLLRYENSTGFSELPANYRQRLNEIYQRTKDWK